MLEKSDVRALNERQLTEQEKEDIRRVCAWTGGDLDNVEDERVIATVAAVSEGQRKPSWIWFLGHDLENMDEPLTRKGELYILYYCDNSCLTSYCLSPTS